jgi:hypothetical protein
MRIAVVLLTVLPAAAATCDSLATLNVPHATISTATPVAAAGETPAYCRVTGVLKPSADSDIRFEVWMPEKWNGKFQGLGNGGFAGAISAQSLTSVVRRGYATAATDTGHQAGGTDASWALGHPEKAIDFGYRAIHETAVVAKAAIAAFYGSGPKKSYFNSCSNGGRQALMEAQRFPEDYDGIIAGAPANNWTHLLANSIWVTQAMTAEPESWIPPAKVAAIEAAAIEACDAKDGVKDGIIDSPDKCGFKPASMLCKGADAESCLTAAQVAALEKILGGLPGAKGRLFPGYVVGGMAGGGGWVDWITGGTAGKSLAFAFGSNFFGNVVYEKKDWDFQTFQPDRDTKLADEKAAAIFNSTNPDMSKFAARGGKLILYHGWSDAAITPLSTIEYYKTIRQSEKFARLFMVPGMGHCSGGPGPNDFGGSPGVSGDALHDIDAALERWVEEGVAPSQLIATKGQRTRPLCPYPQVATYKGSGSTEDASSFVCK